MKAFLIALFILTCVHLSAQSPALARNYYNSGQYEKAIELYKALHEKYVYRTDYFKFLVSSYQQTEKYSMANQVIIDQLKKYPDQLQFNVELGYNYALQGQKDKATSYYEIAAKAVETNPELGYNTGLAFQNNNLLDFALRVYQTAMKKDPNLNFNLQIALIYGEQGLINNMFDMLLNIVESDPTYTLEILRYVGTFTNEDPQNENNIFFKNLLIQRLQTNPNTSWNMLLSWMYMQEKSYAKALIQEKAIFKRQPDDFSRLLALGDITFNDQDYGNSAQCFDFILKNTSDIQLTIQANLYLIKIEIATKTTPKDLTLIDTKFKQLLTDFGFNTNTISIQQVYASFLGYHLNQPNQAIDLLQKSLNLELDDLKKGQLKLDLADLFVYSNQLNRALVAYTQIKMNYKNSVLAQLATFKIAQTSYYKGDFSWAQTQLNVLKSETSQLIANDALQLSVLIENNYQVGDSSALGHYAQAELLAFQNKNSEAVDSLNTILTKFKGFPIETYALYKQAQILEKLKDYDKAEANYLKIITINKTDILADDACFSVAKLYLNKLINTEKASQYFEKIIFDYPSSIYLVEARSAYRQLKPAQLN